MQSPVVLHVCGKVIIVGVRDNQRHRRLAAADGYGKQQILVIGHAVVVVIEVGEILDKFNRAALKYSQVEISANVLHLAAEAKVMLTMSPIHAVIPLQPLLPCLLWNAVGSSIRDAGKVELNPGRYRVGAVDKVVETEAGPVEQRGTEHTRPGSLESLEIVAGILPFRGRTNGSA